MVIGDPGAPGQHVITTVRDPSIEIATNPLLRMEENIVKVQDSFKKHVLEVIVQKMVIGDLGVLGHHVITTVRDLSIEIVTNTLLKMEESIVKVLDQFKKHVLEVIVLLMAIGDLGHLGQSVTRTV